jgi:MFS transporter, DHA1 family, multidrug resistance protein
VSAFIAIVFASLLSRLGYQMARTPVLPIFAADLGAMPELIGVIVAASTVTGVFFKLPSGALSDVLGRKRMMVLGALFFAAPPFLYPFVHDLWSLLALRFVHGFATAIFSPVASAYVASLAESGRGARLGWFSSANDIGATGGPLVGGFVLYFTASFSLTYLLVGALGVLTLLVVVMLPDVDRPARQAKTLAARAAEFRQGLAEVFRTPPIFVAAGIEAVMYLGYGAFLGFLPIYAKKVGLNDAEIAIVLGAQLAMAMVAKPITGRVSDRVGRIPVIIAGLLVCAAALPLIFRRKSDRLRSPGAAARPRRRRGDAGDQCAHRRSRLDTAPGRRHGCVRDHLGHWRGIRTHDRGISDRRTGLCGDVRRARRRNRRRCGWTDRTGARFITGRGPPTRRSAIVR